MDTLDGVSYLTAEDVVLATEAIVPYVLSWPPPVEGEEPTECSVLVLMRRDGGFLLALPSMFLAEEVIEAGNTGDGQAIFGPSLRTVVPLVLEDGGVVSLTGMEAEVLVVDCTDQVLFHMRAFDQSEEAVFNFDEDSPFAFPALESLLAKVRAWARESSEQRTAFYTPDEEEELPPLTPDRPTRRRSATPKAATPIAGGAKPKRVTTAALATDLQALMNSLPAMSQQLTRLVERQDVLEAQLPKMQSASALALGHPLGTALSNPGGGPSLAAKAVQPPPRTATRPSLGLLASPQISKPLELQALEEEKPLQEVESSLTSDNALARAVYAQSQALTTLVAQIAQAQQDPMTDLTIGAGGASTRGAAGRARLQAELASHRGTFFKAVTQAISRRMAPTSSADVAPQELVDRGITGVRYLERFGGYGRHRELGQLQYQVMTAFDFMMCGNMEAAKDTVALLAVTIEQASLDNGRMELATLLCLQEDPPSSIFVNRSLTATSRARSFAPLADQKWVTVALAFLKEMEVITAKRAELTGASSRWVSETSSDATGSTAKAKAKPNAKRKGRGRGQAPSAAQEEAES